MRFKVIPGLPQHDVVYGAATGVDGRIYLGVSNESHPGLHALIYRYDPDTDTVTRIVDFAELFPEARDPVRPPHCKIHLTLCIGGGGRVYAASHLTAPPIGDRCHRVWETYDDPRRGYTGSHLVMHDPSTGEVRDLGIVMEREGMQVMTADPARDELYMISYPRSHFLVYRVATGEVIDLGRISFERSFGLCCSMGYVYTADDYGYLLRYDPERVRMERLPVQIPDAPWRDGGGNIIRRMALGLDGVRMYGMGAKSARLFEYDPSVGPFGRITDFGLLSGEDRPDGYSWLPAPKAITVGLDGKVYCALGNRTYYVGPEPASHIVSFDPETREAVDHGPMEADGLPPILDCQDATTGLDGHLYFAPRVAEPPLRFVIFTPSGVGATVQSPLQKTTAAGSPIPAGGREHALWHVHGGVPEPLLVPSAPSSEGGE